MSDSSNGSHRATQSVRREEALQKLLSAEDRAWLEQMLLEYREVLDYLREH